MAALANTVWRANAALLAPIDKNIPRQSAKSGEYSRLGLNKCDNLHSAAWFRGDSVSATARRQRQQPAGVARPGLQVRAEVRSEQKVRVVLGPYKEGAIKVQAPTPKVAPEEVEKAWKAKSEKKYVLERINFTGSGAKLGHTVRLKFEGKYVEGPLAGQTIKGTKADDFELELKERDDEPWSSFVKEITGKGMGQEESKSFQLQFPADYKAKPLAGVKAQFTVTVKEIGVKRALEADTRPLEEQRAALEAELQATAERVTNDAVDAQIRDALLDSSEADVEKVAASVTWAKFGEKSLRDFKWNVLQEEIARVESIPFDSVSTFLRSQAAITYT